MKEKIGNDFLYNIYCSSMMNYLFAKKIENIVGQSVWNMYILA